MKTYVVFAPAEIKGLYKSWSECKALIFGVRGPSYCSYKTYEEAERALKAGSLRAAKAADVKAKIALWRSVIPLPCLVVDAACSGCPGPVEFRGVVLSTKEDGFEVFRCGPYPNGTNNLGEFLAIVTGLKWLESTSLTYKLYSDSFTAINWVKTYGYCNTKLPNVGRELAMQLKVAESWLQLASSRKYVERIEKWDTHQFGEVPADYDRK
jgi:ribonuclease HI